MEERVTFLINNMHNLFTSWPHKRENLLPVLVADVYTGWKNHESLAHATSLRDEVINTASVGWAVPWENDDSVWEESSFPWKLLGPVTWLPHETQHPQFVSAHTTRHLLGEVGAMTTGALGHCFPSKGSLAHPYCPPLLLITGQVCLITQTCRELIILYSHSMATNVGIHLHPDFPSHYL